MLTNWNPARMPEKDEMKLRLSTARKQLYDLQMKIKEHKIPVIVLFEGWGTSGKGSTIGKVIRNIDPRFFKVVTMSEPTDEELRYPFLYRFFKEIPEAGKFTFLDSGWLEQICREHLEGKTDEKEYASRIESVRNFERQLTDNGYLVLKFFMQIEKKEQKEREQDLLESKVQNGVFPCSISGKIHIIKNAKRHFQSTCQIQMHLPHHGISLMQVTRSGQSCR